MEEETNLIDQISSGYPLSVKLSQSGAIRICDNCGKKYHIREQGIILSAGSTFGEGSVILGIKNETPRVLLQTAKYCACSKECLFEGITKFLDILERHATDINYGQPSANTMIAITVENEIYKKLLIADQNAEINITSIISSAIKDALAKTKESMEDEYGLKLNDDFEIVDKKKLASTK